MKPASDYVARVSVEGDIKGGLAFVPQARQLLFNLQEKMRRGGLDIGAATLRLSDTSYAIARITKGINAVHIVSGSVDAAPAVLTVSDSAPDFVSGVVTDGRLKSATNSLGQSVEYLTRFYPTQRCAITHRDLTANAGQAMQRLAVLPAAGFSELEAPSAAQFLNTQYAELRPTMYSGRMKEVVQALMGFGKQLPKTSPTGQGQVPPAQVDGEPLNLSKTRSIYAKILTELAQEAGTQNKLPTTYERDVAENGLQIRYDWRFPRTHGICTAADGKLWLIEIGMTRGVLAMPLPFNALTVQPKPTTANPTPRWKFREALEELEIVINASTGQTAKVRDEDGLKVLDELGGFPTGENFPDKRDLIDTMIRAGEVLELIKPEDMEPFYRNTFYSSSMGWAFSTSGTEAHNTGYRYETDGVQRGVHYAVNLTIGTERTYNAPFVAELQAKLDAAQSTVDAEKRRVLRRKIERLSSSQAATLRLYDNQRLVDQLDQMQVLPLATGSARLTLQREGHLINRGTRTQYQIKFYEPLLGYLLSHDFRPEIQGTSINVPCDTTMHVFFDGSDLKWVRYFYDPDTASNAINESDFEECMFVGSWTSIQASGARMVSRAYYTSDFDDRAVSAESITTTKVRGEALGPVRVGVSDDLGDIRRSYAFREHAFKLTTETTTRTGESILTAVGVPQGVREGYYHARMVYADTQSYTKTQYYRYQLDAWSAEGWRCIPSTAGAGVWPGDLSDCGPGCPQGINLPGFRGVGTQPRIARYINHDTSSACIEITDRGQWIDRCDNIDSKLYNIPLPPLPATEVVNEVRKGQLRVRLVMAGPPRTKEVLLRDYTNTTWVLPRWFLMSPDPDTGLVQLLNAAFSAFGDTESAVYHKDINGEGGREIYGPITYIDLQPSTACYIGVI